MSKSIPVTFIKPDAISHDGLKTIDYKEGDTAELSEELYAGALKRGTIAGGKKAISGAPENKAITGGENDSNAAAAQAAAAAAKAKAEKDAQKQADKEAKEAKKAADAKAKADKKNKR